MRRNCATLAAERGCDYDPHDRPRCQNLGYRGRVGIFELMRMSDSIHSLVIKSASAPDIREVALNEGMSTLQGSGWQQIKRGLTTIDEVIRYADGSVEE